MKFLKCFNFRFLKRFVFQVNQENIKGYETLLAPAFQEFSDKIKSHEVTNFEEIEVDVDKKSLEIFNAETAKIMASNLDQPNKVLAEQELVTAVNNLVNNLRAALIETRKQRTENALNEAKELADCLFKYEGETAAKECANNIEIGGFSDLKLDSAKAKELVISYLAGIYIQSGPKAMNDAAMKIAEAVGDKKLDFQELMNATKLSAEEGGSDVSPFEDPALRTLLNEKGENSEKVYARVVAYSAESLRYIKLNLKLEGEFGSEVAKKYYAYLLKEGGKIIRESGDVNSLRSISQWVHEEEPEIMEIAKLILIDKKLVEIKNKNPRLAKKLRGVLLGLLEGANPVHWEAVIDEQIKNWGGKLSRNEDEMQGSIESFEDDQEVFREMIYLTVGGRDSQEDLQDDLQDIFGIEYDNDNENVFSLELRGYVLGRLIAAKKHFGNDAKKWMGYKKHVKKGLQKNAGKIGEDFGKAGEDKEEARNTALDLVKANVKTAQDFEKEYVEESGSEPPAPAVNASPTGSVSPAAAPASGSTALPPLPSSTPTEPQPANVPTETESEQEKPAKPVEPAEPPTALESPDSETPEVPEEESENDKARKMAMNDILNPTIGYFNNKFSPYVEHSSIETDPRVLIQEILKEIARRTQTMKDAGRLHLEDLGDKTFVIPAMDTFHLPGYPKLGLSANKDGVFPNYSQLEDYVDALYKFANVTPKPLETDETRISAREKIGKIFEEVIGIYSGEIYPNDKIKTLEDLEREMGTAVLSELDKAFAGVQISEDLVVPAKSRFCKVITSKEGRKEVEMNKNVVKAIFDGVAV